MRGVLLAVSILVFSGYADCVRDEQKGVVLDRETRLMWQDNEDTVNIKLSWEKAIAHCEASEFLGFSDWRLPTKQELLSIVDKSKEEIKLDSTFENRSSYVYWSSSNTKSGLPLAWRVNFDDGKAHWGAKRFTFLVRCVRDAEVLP